jgi:hypothetical protein
MYGKENALVVYFYLSFFLELVCIGYEDGASTDLFWNRLTEKRLSRTI